ncbi:kelch-like protein 5 isoform X2 [Canis lupus baileyi]|nr:kelch-like protein 5 isoform X2 [Canis lupus familiaris]XP_025294437.1 kelch-like protein 5 isoform X2 [Canis lupus dingo]XP_038389401.1 kelch-like protein 5 isoform X2 [Canis lupus familiaris]XP_038517904.1 kelch-like protein 5 isoform X2 [Canis lupus familiaris]|eukprot:XP_013968112.1 kelch-like protein 5 isoform X2 [Canis lupus familiaris]
MSGSRKEFDVKQILKIRWRWFSHQASSNSTVDSQQGEFWNRGQTGANGGRKFLDPCSLQLPLASIGYRRSSQLDFQNSPSWPMASTSEVPAFEFTAEDCGGAHWLDRPEVDDGTSEEENESDSSSCRTWNSELWCWNNNKYRPAIYNHLYNGKRGISLHRTSNSSQTLSSCHTMEPCSSDEFFQALNHAEQTFKKMENYLRHKQLCDVILVAGDRRIPAHRLVLSSVSDYFAAMFTNDVREARQEEIKMEGVEPNSLWSLIQYAYTGRLELKEDNIECLLSTACLLQLSQVVEACCKFLMKQLHPSNCLGIRSFADAQGCTDLHKVAHNYTMEHFMEVIRNQEFVLLPASEIAKLLASDDMNIPNEETILNALLTWVRHDLEQRRKDLSKLLAYIRLPLLAPQFLADMENNALFRDDIECQKLIMEAMKYHLLPERRPMLQSPRTKPRKSTVGTLFAVGGMDSTKGVAVLEGPMYAVGGHDGWSYLNTVERWDPQARQWNFVATMSTPRSTVGVAVLSGKLYAVGGRDGSSCLKSVECFDPHTNKWTLCAQMSKRRGGVGVTTWNGLLYAIGGHDAPASNLTSRLSDCVERYDPKTDMWTAVASMSISRDAVGVCLLGDKLYAVGGYDGQTYLNTVEAYDPQTNEWTQVAPLCLGRAGACVVTVKL